MKLLDEEIDAAFARAHAIPSTPTFRITPFTAFVLGLCVGIAVVVIVILLLGQTVGQIVAGR